MATATELARVRQWVGTDAPTDAAIEAILADLDRDTNHAALQVLRQRRADMLASPSIMAVDGDASRSWVTNLTELAKQIEQLEVIVGTEGAGSRVPSLSTGSITRPTPTR